MKDHTYVNAQRTQKFEKVRSIVVDSSFTWDLGLSIREK